MSRPLGRFSDPPPANCSLLYNGIYLIEIRYIDYYIGVMRKNNENCMLPTCITHVEKWREFAAAGPASRVRRSTGGSVTVPNRTDTLTAA